ncbi:heterodisulfide reductase subunit A [Desulfobacula phenolica]|uniref:Heterodisulfide reductase subunit A n=2 Tax=Desulfobacula phenolica TaxID=90732 RepID=A0A1H2EJB3_9BACT|nr:heterodisulfide reductase subunit A [Desulfobacula phenolica]
MEFERILSATGPTMGHVTTFPKLPVKPKKKKDKLLAEKRKDPKKIAWFQCVGSRDVNKCDNPYCSSVCCMYAVKEAIIAKEHAGSDLDCSIFFMDMRTPGKEFEKYYQTAKEKHGINFIRSRVHSVTENPETHDLDIRYVDELGQIIDATYDMIVLSVGLEIPPETKELAQKLGIDLTPSGFCKTDSFEPVSSSRDGVYVSGVFNNPKDIPESVLDASAAASAAGDALSSARDTLTKAIEKTPEINVVGERPRIGAFICDCGSNIKGVVDCAAVTEYAKTLPYVEFADEAMYACSQDAQDKMVEYIKEKNLNRIVVAACTPKTHEPLFQETLANAGLNKYLFEMTNIRNHNSWVHKNNPELATEKAKDLVRMAIAKAALAEPLKEEKINVNDSVVVIGGGLAGMTSAKSLATQGYQTHIIEKKERLGGEAHKLYKTAQGENVQAKLDELIKEIESNDNITVHCNTTLESVDGFVGNFKSTLKNADKEFELEYGVAVLATGAKAFVTDEYEYGKDDRIITSLDLDKMFKEDDARLDALNSAVFIQCVGSRQPDRPYCSRVCCTHSVDSAIELKERKPDMDVFILYRDIRTYGERELLYKKARELGVIFIRYDVENKPAVRIADGKVLIKATDHVLNQPIEIEADLLTLATAIVPRRDEKLANFYKVPLNDEGFFVEKHAKLGPAEFATDGVFVCGSGHYPKPVNEAITQGRASASRALTLLAKKESLFTSGTIASVDQMKCSQCGVCVSICPYSAPGFVTEGRFEGKAEVNPVLCKGCGLCVASCRSGALHLRGFDTNQIFSQIFALGEVG